MRFNAHRPAAKKAATKKIVRNLLRTQSVISFSIIAAAPPAWAGPGLRGLTRGPAGATPIAPMRDSESIRKLAEVTTSSPPESPEITSTYSFPAAPVTTSRGA